MNVKQKLIEAKALIDTPEKWCGNGPGEPGVTARAVVSLHIVTKEARSQDYWALVKVTDYVGTPRGVFDPLPPPADNGSPYPVSLSEFNDSHTYDEVMALFDDAIARCD